MVYRTPEKDSYSYHDRALPRIVGAIANYPSDWPLYRGGIKKLAEVSYPIVIAHINDLRDEGLVEEAGKYMLMGPNKRPTPLLTTTENFAPAVAANPEWSRAAVIKGLMMATGQTEGWVLDQALARAGRDITVAEPKEGQLTLPFEIPPSLNGFIK